MVVIGLSFTPSSSIQSNVSYATFIIIILRINYENYIHNVNYSASYAQCVCLIHMENSMIISIWIILYNKLTFHCLISMHACIPIAIII